MGALSCLLAVKKPKVLFGFAMRSHAWLLCLLVFSLMSARCQQVNDCPVPWQSNGDYCYSFVGDIPLKFDSASMDCNDHGASLLYITSIEEHNFIKNFLERFDGLRRKWLTSGHGVITKSTVLTGTVPFEWVATATALQPDPAFWLQGEPNVTSDTSSSVVAYAFGASGFGWSLVSESKGNPYICKILKYESYRILQSSRDFDYGLAIENVGVIERGPQFTLMPNSLVVVSSTGESAVLDCIAFGIPEPTYTWVRGKTFEDKVLASTSPRYSLINGRLVIQNPVEAQDSNTYRCEASNKFGTVISSSVAISFGYLGDFSNVKNAPVRANAYDGVAVQCSQISFKPAVQYQWFKDGSQFIRPEFQSYIFISNNGKLYFSEVTRSDEGQYQCIAVLTGVNQYTIGTSQPPTRASLPIPLLVADQTPKSNWGPEIQNDFPAVFPQPPLRGQDVRLECFAYGSSTTPFYYSWKREGLPLPATAVFEDYSRVMIIRNAQLEDAGTYTCDVTRSSNARDSRSVYLALGARPYFVASLKNQHADLHSHLTWRCEARGNPSPIYRWYKNGRLVTSDPQARIEVSKNVLVITDLETKLHEGMYQCEASNSHGSEMSNAQLRVLSFAPTFAKHPLPPQVSGALGGDLVIACNPEGAPLPQITWMRNGAQLTTGADGHYTQLPSGNLVITKIQGSDAGPLTCKAMNDQGEAQSSTSIFVASGATISTGPTSVTAVVNETAFMQCYASRDTSTDVTYAWYFNDHPLDLTDPTFAVVDTHATGRTGLYVKGVQFRHEGQYKCVLRTPFSEDFKSGYLTVRGPPSMPAGVYAPTGSVTTNSVIVMWTVGADNGGSIVAFQVEAENEFNPDEWTVVLTAAARDTIPTDISQTDKRSAVADGLNPGNGYRFRVAAQNEFGIGTPSTPSAIVKTADAPPAVAPRNVRGGGGSVGDLTIRWDLLDRSEWGSISMYYRIYWRKKATDGGQEGQWQWATKSETEDHHITLVGTENFFLLYEVKVQAVNTLGQGPNSSIEEVYSAEDLPLGTPTNVYSETYNSTTIQVFWTPVPDTREAARGQILGYQINYWPQDLDAKRKDNWQFIRYYGDIDNGLVINLGVQVNTWADVQVYNLAGLGPHSEAFMMETAFYPSWHYPEEIRVFSAGVGRARVWWRGILTTTWEAGLTHYAVFYWNANEDFRNQKEVQVKIPATEAMLEDLDDNTLYAVRVCGLNAGGYGARSPTQYFTFEGSVFIDYGLSQTIDVYLAHGTCLRPAYALCLLLVIHTFFARIHC